MHAAFVNRPYVRIGRDQTLSSILIFQGKTDEAGHLYGRSLNMLERALGPNHLNVAYGLSSLGKVLRAQVKSAFMGTYPGEFLGTPWCCRSNLRQRASPEQFSVVRDNCSVRENVCHVRCIAWCRV